MAHWKGLDRNSHILDLSFQYETHLTQAKLIMYQGKEQREMSNEL